MHTLKELEALPTITVGQSDDLKIQTATKRVWLSRMGIEDGMPCNNMVTEEVYINGVWDVDREYEAL